MAQKTNRTEVETSFWNIPDKILILYAHKCFGWKKVGGQVKTEYTASDEGKAKKSYRTIYYYARPADFQAGLFFRICEGLNDFARFIRRLAVPVFLLSCILMLLTMGAFEEFLMSVMGYSVIAFVACAALNIVLPIFGALSGGLAPSRSRVSKDQIRAEKRVVSQRRAENDQQSQREQVAAQAKSRQMKAEKLEKEVDEQARIYNESKYITEQGYTNADQKAAAYARMDSAANRIAEIEEEAKSEGYL